MLKDPGELVVAKHATSGILQGDSGAIGIHTGALGIVVSWDGWELLVVIGTLPIYVYPDHFERLRE